jgi:homoserine O-succinyltransferase
MLRIGILNNMPEAATRSTERQFTELLTEAALEIPIQIGWFCFFPRAGYAMVDDLWEISHLDGLVVTGTEPRESRLENEPYWRVFTKTVEWATAHTTSAVWSCLAAHAAVLHLDDVRRQPFPTKLHGVFDVDQQQQHPLLRRTARSWQLPHSRWNDLPLHSLLAKDYQVLTLGVEVGADMFVKTCGDSLFWFNQGHPEYDARSLMREYRRDILRYHNGERPDYPALPLHYFDVLTAGRLQAISDRAMSYRNPDVSMVDFQGVIGKANLEAPWRATAVQLYHNWLTILSSQQAKPERQAAL